MENLQTEETVVLQVNGVAIDMDVIAKDAEIEMNNNEAAKNVVEKMADQETIPEMPTNQLEQNDEPKTAESVESSMNTTHTDNGSETDAHNEVTTTEGDFKVDQADETNDAATETKETPESTPTDIDSGMDSKDENQPETESSKQNQEEETSENPTETTSNNVTEKSEQDTSSNEQNTSSEGQEENTVSSTSASDDDETKDGTQASTSENNEANETIKSDSSKKSPRKRSPRKRKNRTNSHKKDVDYTKYEKYTVSVNQRQRRYYLVGTRGFNVPVPGDDCEIFCTNIPINVLEGELIPLFERYGKIWELRLMMSMRNPKRNAGFAFVRFTAAGAAKEAAKKLNNYEILPGKLLSVRLSQPNLSLFVGNIHRGLTQEQIHEKLSNKTKGLVKTFVKTSLYEETKNCGFCFLEYDSHSDALQAKRLLNRNNVWGRQLFVDWAQRRKQTDPNDVHESKTLFINYLPKETTEEQITETLAAFGTIKKITKIKDYAFVLFEEHEQANNAMVGAEKAKLGHEKVQISLAMPKSMKSRPRYPSFNGYRQRRNGRHRSFKSFGSSIKFHMRNQHKTTNVNETATQNGSAQAATEQATTIPMPMQTETEIASYNVAPGVDVQQTTILPMSEHAMAMTVGGEALVH